MTGFRRQPMWYKDAVIYEVPVKSFCDSDGSGTGDFRGLIGKLDYLRDLGVTAIWLLPFYPSPLRDDGYDIEDYKSVNPLYGTLDDFDEFLEQAHARGLYVITELVINHTSDRHPWFQRARIAPPGSPERDFYVWSEDKERYKGVRIIFSDTETSNWAWDPVSKSFYWHRFYSHQPDLNFDNPKVHEAVLDVVDFWMRRGVDGMRLDAIPYLYEREGTSCENLPETHAFLRKLAAHIEEHYDHRMLLGEANQWPEDATAYFGGGEACDMAFHFPLMPRMYMAVEMEDGFPIVDILEQTPPIPSNCQWALFLRNHDELTLEMVTDSERDYMYRMYAKDRRARINLGIRRRLAPLLMNNRRKIELLNMLLFSLPGSPVLYYGDELGMGDNLYLGDRDGVRTPMQWNMDRNAGFSRAFAQHLYLPVIIDPEYHYETVNVENQERDPGSLLWWMRRAIQLRQRHRCFSRGSLRFLKTENSHILAFLREEEGGGSVLVVANLSRNPQTGQLNLAGFEGAQPMELSGSNAFPQVRAEPYPLMLGAYDAFWLLLRAAGEAPAVEAAPLPDLGEAATLADLLRKEGRREETRLLLPLIQDAPWFEGRRRQLRSLDVSGILPLSEGQESGLLVLLRARFLDAEPQEYALLLAFAAEQEPGAGALNGGPPIARPLAKAVIGRKADNRLLIGPSFIIARPLARAVVGGRRGWLCEGERFPSVQEALLKKVFHPLTFPLGSGQIVMESVPGRTDAPVHLPENLAQTVQLHETEGEELHILAPHFCYLRWFRRAREGPRNDFEILTELTLETDFPNVPRCLALARYRPPGEETRVLGYIQEWIDADRDASALASEHLRRFLEGIATSGLAESEPGPLPPARVGFHALPESFQTHLGGAWAEFIVLLGRRVCELHQSLCSLRSPDFAPEPYTLLHQHSVYHAIRTPMRRTLVRLAREGDSLPPELLPLAHETVEREAELLARIKSLIDHRIEMQRFRLHGNLVLENILFTGKDFVFVRFDGEPWRPLAENRFRFSALRDVSALQHSLAVTAMESWEGYTGAGAGNAGLARWAGHWAALSGAMVLEAYLEKAEGEAFLPRSGEDTLLLLNAFRIERAAFELNTYLGGPRTERLAAALRTLLAQAGNPDRS